MIFERRSDGSEPLRPEPVTQQEHRLARSSRMATGTLACPQCDAPVALAGRRASLSAPLGCPFCGHAAALRDFLSLAAPARPARVAINVVRRVG